MTEQAPDVGGGLGLLEKPDEPPADFDNIEHIVCVACFPNVKEGDPIVTICGIKKKCGPLHMPEEIPPGAICTMCVESERSHVIKHLKGEL